MKASPNDHRAIAGRLCDWFKIAQRDLPWRQGARSTRRDPYQTLVSEFMLQQTQVSRVLEYFPNFIDRFPSVAVLARAREQSVLSMWSGLGYYRRAKHLHGAARAIRSDYDGVVPSDPADLLALPGIGRYSAGAISSLAFDRPEPIVDGNISRVLLRLHGKSETAAQASDWTWKTATAIVRAAASAGLSPGDNNEALMELGATVCTPRGPKCEECPLSGFCNARKQGSQEDIPLPKQAAKRSVIYCASVVATDPRGRVLLEQRPSTGMWADMWQTPTLERDDRPPTAAQLSEYLLEDVVDAGVLTEIGAFKHVTTHRDVQFTVYAASHATTAPRRGCASKGPRALAQVALSNAQRKVIEMVKNMSVG